MAEWIACLPAVREVSQSRTLPAAMLSSIQSAGVAPEVNLRNNVQVRNPPWLWNPGQASPEVQNRDISGTTKRTCVLQKIFKKEFSVLPSNREIVRVATCQGKVREKQNFLQVRELPGNFEKMSGYFVHFTNVREFSGNFVMTINFFPKIIRILLLVYFFQVLKFLLALFSLSIHSRHTFFKSASLLLWFYINWFYSQHSWHTYKYFR